MTNSIEIDRLRKAYGEEVAIEDLSLTVPAGSLFGFIGPNGAGKTTTVGCMSGLLDFEGSIRMLGQPMHSNAAELKRRIGVMPDTLALFDGLYAHEFLMFIARLYGLDRATARERVHDLLEALGIAAESGKPLLDFSSGMRKRVALAAAVVHTPEIVLLDEPFESIDPAGTAMIKAWLRRMVAQGRTVFLTSHVLETIEQLCDRVAIITRPGRLLWSGAIGSSSAPQRFVADGNEFTTLEELYLHLVGGRQCVLRWL